MLLIPTVACKAGKCEAAGLVPGSEPPDQAALRFAAAWVTSGARRLHVTDGDTGLASQRVGVEVVRALAQAHPDVPIQVAGNFRDGDDVGRYLGAGAEYVVLDAKTAGSAHFINDLCLEYPGHVLMTVEARGAKAAAGSWSKLARHPLAESARRFQQEGVAGILYRAVPDTMGACDISPAVELTNLLMVPVFVSADIKSFANVTSVCALATGLAGVVLDSGYRSSVPEFGAAVQLTAQVRAAE